MLLQLQPRYVLTFTVLITIFGDRPKDLRSVIPEPTASPLPGNLLEVQLWVPDPRPESETLGVEAQQSVLRSLPGNSNVC